MKASEIRSRFVDYFERQGHERLPSGPLVPEDDPTLLFANAGMVQFKSIFVGEQDAPTDRAVTSQKCLRVSGKHNDLEEVGRTARHHTFFEMLGNFSFGDYFKREAIHYGWEFVTEELGLERERLWATVHHTDDEARRIWEAEVGLPAERILDMGDEENFWQMGDTGPCGPCSEIHYDLRSEDATDDLGREEFRRLGEADRFMELWNLVFMQFDRDEEGNDRPLPAPSIDTGAGLERLAAVLQGVRTNYHTDLFMPLIREAEELVGEEYSTDPDDWEEGMGFRVLADHARAVAFLLADGVFPANEGRGYVLRRVLRRAGRHAWLLGRREPTLEHLVDRVVDQMGDAYPELETRRQHLRETTRAEEERFLATIDEGMARFDQVAPEDGGGTIPGEEAFKLYDTFGFPLDLTELMAEERGYDVDVEGFEEALEEQRERSRRERGGAVEERVDERIASLSAGEQQEWVGYDRLRVETEVLEHEDFDGRHAFLLRENPFYAESGGQVSDTGRVEGEDWAVEVDRVVENERGQTIVAGPPVRGEVPDGGPDRVVARVEESARRNTERNHTATHLLHAALRDELGDHVQQAGSLVAPDRLRFDFSHREPLSPGERRRVERTVNRAVWANTPVETDRRGYREALGDGAVALFGETYGDVVRVVEVPGVSLELCGGTHVRSTGQIGLFKIVGETGVAAGIRRVEAVTGPAAYERVVEMEDRLNRIAGSLRVAPSDAEGRVERLLEERERLEEALSSRRGEEAEDLAERLVEEDADELPAGGRLLVAGDVRLPAGAEAAGFGDRLRAALGSGAAVVHLVWPDEDKQAFLAVVTDDWIQRGLRAGALVREASQATGSGGGGKAHFAQGGVGDPEKVADGLDAARSHARDAAEPVARG